MLSSRLIIAKRLISIITVWLFVFSSMVFADTTNVLRPLHLRAGLVFSGKPADLPEDCVERLNKILSKPEKGEPFDISLARKRLNNGLQARLGHRIYVLKQGDELIIREQKLDVTVIGSAMFDLVVPLGEYPFPDWPGTEDLEFADDRQIGQAMAKLPQEITAKVKRTPGGPGQAEAFILASVGANVKMVASLGDDEYADELISKMKKAGIDVSGIKKIKGRPTAMTYIPSGKKDGEDVTAFAHSMGADDELDISYLTDDDYKVEVFHAGGVALTPKFMRGGLAIALQRAKQEGAVTVMDTVVDKLYIWQELEKSGEADEICKNLDVLTISKKEAGQYTDLEDPETIVNYFLNKGVKTVIYKMGKEGSIAGSRNSPVFSDTEPVSVPVYSKAGYKVVDGTGMGDAFSGAMSSGIIRGYSLGETLAFATSVASLAGEQIGGGDIGPNGERGAIERKAELIKQPDVLSAVTKIDTSSYSENKSGIVNIDDYLMELENESSGAVWELKALYEEDWMLRRERMQTLLKRYKELYPDVKEIVITRAPGRVTANEHTDYNDAASVGMATKQDHIVVVGLNADENRMVFNNMKPSKFPKGEWTVEHIESMRIQPAQRKADVPWTKFSIAIIQNLMMKLYAQGTKLKGLCMLVDGREEYGGVPIESNISSSAAFEVAQIYAIEAILGIKGKLTSGEVIEIGRSAEAMLGFPCGKLDQGSSSAGRPEVKPYDRKGAIIDCVPRVDEKGKDKTVIKNFTIPNTLQAILLNTGEKGQTQREYNIRVIEGELGSWILNKTFKEFLGKTGQNIRMQKVQEIFGDINKDHNKRPYLYSADRGYPVFLKPGFYASSMLKKVGVNVSPEEIEKWVKQKLSTFENIDNLKGVYGKEFLDFYVQSALPFHYSLAVNLLKEHNIEVEENSKITPELLREWVEAVLKGNLKSKYNEMEDRGIECNWFLGINTDTYNLQGTVLHAIGDQDRSEEIEEALNYAATKSGAGQMNALVRFGELQRDGYVSLRDNYRNSTPIIDKVVNWASSQDWCLVPGSCRHFGAGWGGWMEIWIKPGKYNEAYTALSKWLEKQTWYKEMAKKNLRDLKTEHSFSIMPYKPGAPASVMGGYSLDLTAIDNNDLAIGNRGELGSNI